MDLKSAAKNYRYLDGSGNEYKINSKLIEYNPVKPHVSSSGIYNGGNYVKKELKEVQYDQLSSILNTAIENKKIHITNRIKRSGIIIVQNKEMEKTCILNPDSKELKDIEKLLIDIIS